MTTEEAKKQASELKSRLKSATTNEEIVIILDEVREDMEMSGFRKPVNKYKAEVILNHKKPRVNATTREAYRDFVTIARGYASGNSAMLAKVKALEKVVF